MADGHGYQVARFNDQRGLVATRRYATGDFVLLLDDLKDLDSSEVPGAAALETSLLNHSCDPNLRLLSNGGGVYAVAHRPINPGEELTYHYCSVFGDLKKDEFACHCGSENCLGDVAGFKHLGKSEKEALRPLLLPHLLASLEDTTPMKLPTKKSEPKPAPTERSDLEPRAAQSAQSTPAEIADLEWDRALERKTELEAKNAEFEDEFVDSADEATTEKH